MRSTKSSRLQACWTLHIIFTVFIEKMQRKLNNIATSLILRQIKGLIVYIVCRRMPFGVTTNWLAKCLSKFKKCPAQKYVLKVGPIQNEIFLFLNISTTNSDVFHCFFFLLRWNEIFSEWKHFKRIENGHKMAKCSKNGNGIIIYSKNWKIETER